MKNGTRSQAILRRWAMDALREYDRVSGGGCTVVVTIPLLMASLAHLADQVSEEDGGHKALADAIDLYKTELEAAN